MCPKYLLTFYQNLYSQYQRQINAAPRNQTTYTIILLTNKTTKLSYQIYKYLLNSPQVNSKWIVSVQSLLSNAGRQDIWLNQNESTPKSTGKLIKQTLIDQFFQQWNSQLDNSSKGRNYSIFKNNIQPEIDSQSCTDAFVIFKIHTIR